MPAPAWGIARSAGRPITAQTREQIIERINQFPSGAKFAVLAPVIRAQKGGHRELFVDLLKQGFMRARVDGQIVQLTDDLQLDRQMRHNIEVVIDRLVVGQPRGRLAEAVDLALKMGEGSLVVAPESADAAAEEGGRAGPEPKVDRWATCSFRHNMPARIAA